jgi:hypothetical protein
LHIPNALLRTESMCFLKYVNDNRSLQRAESLSPEGQQKNMND